MSANRQASGPVAAEAVEVMTTHEGGKLLTPCLTSISIRIEGGWIGVQLTRDVRDHRGGRHFARLQRAAGMAQGAEQQRVTQTIVSGRFCRDAREIVGA